MTHALIIARRELRERSFILALAGVLALIPFAMALMPFGRRFGRELMLAGTAGALSIVFTIGLGIILGASLVGRELSERRMSFYFSRPISPASIWFGKLMAAAVALPLAYGIILLPSLLFSRRVWTAAGWNVSPPQLAAAVIGASLLLLLIAHFGSVMIRSRSSVVVVDLVLIVASITVAVLIVRPLAFNMAMRLVEVMIYVFVGALFVVLLAAGAWQLSRGRTDLRRNHRALSTFTWVSMAVVLAIAAAYVAWVLAAEPSDITKPYAQQGPGGRWVIIGGDAKGRFDFMPVFAMNLDDGKWMRMTEARWSGGEFTRDGSALILTKPVEKLSMELSAMKLEPQIVRYKHSVPFWPGATAALADDAPRVAIAGNGILSVHDIENGALLGSVRLPSPKLFAPRLFFVNRDTVRLYLQDADQRSRDNLVVSHHLEIYEFNVPTRKLERTGEHKTTARWLGMRVSTDGSTLLLRRIADGENTLLIADARTAAVRSTINVAAGLGSAVFLADGRIAAYDTANKRCSLRLFDRNGVQASEVGLAECERAVISDIGHPNVLLLSLWQGNARRLVTVNATSGAIIRQEEGVYAWPQSAWDPRTIEPPRNGELVIRDAKGSIWRWNALTGAKKLIVKDETAS